MLRIKLAEDDPHLLAVEGQSGTTYVDDKTTSDLDSKEPEELDDKAKLNWGCVPYCYD